MKLIWHSCERTLVKIVEPGWCSECHGRAMLVSDGRVEIWWHADRLACKAPLRRFQRYLTRQIDTDIEDLILRDKSGTCDCAMCQANRDRSRPTPPRSEWRSCSCDACIALQKLLPELSIGRETS